MTHFSGFMDKKWTGSRAVQSCDRQPYKPKASVHALCINNNRPFRKPSARAQLSEEEAVALFFSQPLLDEKRWMNRQSPAVKKSRIELLYSRPSAKIVYFCGMRLRDARFDMSLDGRFPKGIGRSSSGHAKKEAPICSVILQVAFDRLLVRLVSRRTI